MYFTASKNDTTKTPGGHMFTALCLLSCRIFITTPGWGGVLKEGQRGPCLALSQRPWSSHTGLRKPEWEADVGWLWLPRIYCSFFQKQHLRSPQEIRLPSPSTLWPPVGLSPAGSGSGLVAWPGPVGIRAS